MSLITCPECGREVSDQAASCPQCGYPIKASRDLWRVQKFLPNRRASLESCAKSATPSLKVKWIVRGDDSIATKELYPRAIAEEILKVACPPHSKNRAQLIPPDPGEALPELSDAPRCPKCGSYALKTEKDGFNFGKAAFGTVLFGPVVGGAAGLIDSGGSVTVCSNCGHKF